MGMNFAENYAEPDATTTSELVEQCLNGNEHAWNLLVQRYARLVHAIAVRHNLPPAEVDDIGQDVFVALAQHLHEIQDPERLPGWLVTTARRLCWRAVQRRRAEISLDPAGGDEDEGAAVHQLESPQPTPDSLVDVWGRQQMLDQAMELLHERCQQLIGLIFLDPAEPSYDEISVQLGIPKGSIGPTRNRCLQQLRSILRGLGVSQVKN